ncbi:MAG TPA: hypothetical protein VJV58_14555, partial [Bradyrhizobium sp.]|uniref:hypothetical protein n=1 Tax=Bradyrhizobium sp. TaxID=376 RepID=UPI002B47A5BD
MHLQDRAVSLKSLPQSLNFPGHLSVATKMDLPTHKADEFQHAAALPHAEIIEVDLLSGLDCNRFLFDKIVKPSDYGQQAAGFVRPDWRGRIKCSLTARIP